MNQYFGWLYCWWYGRHAWITFVSDDMDDKPVKLCVCCARIEMK